MSPHSFMCSDILTIAARDAVALVCNVTLSTFLFVDIRAYSTLNLKAYLTFLIPKRISERGSRLCHCLYSADYNKLRYFGMRI